MYSHKSHYKIAVFAAMSLLLTACAAGRGTYPPPTDSDRRDTTQRETQAESPETDVNQSGESESLEQSPVRSSILQEDGLFGSYFKAGDFSYHLELTPGGQKSIDSVTFVFSLRDLRAPDFSNARAELYEFQLPRAVSAESYTVEDIRSESDRRACTLTVGENGVITLSDGTDASGDYYSYKEHLFLPDAFERPLNATDLIGLSKKDLQMIRNEFYAVYGRIFQNKDLNSYFENQPWYRGHIEAEQFPESVLGGLFKRNIEFLRMAEETYDDMQADKIKMAYESLPQAPYLALLPQYGETQVTIAAELESAADRGIYFSARGTIAVPVTLTYEQYEQVEAGKEVALVMDELTGQTQIFKKAGDTSYGRYILGNEEDGNYVETAYHPETGLFSLWRDSADTVFKPVYEGELYILRGAMEEYYGYFEIPAQENFGAAGTRRAIDFHAREGEVLEPYYGNYLIADEKGYVKALYFVGD